MTICFHKIDIGLKLIFIFFTFFISPIYSQTFLKVTDHSNPIVTANYASNYSGAAWIDFNNDGNLDLYATKNLLFSGDGNGNFEIVDNNLGLELSGQSNGPTWGDYDNDGDIDCFIAGNPSRLYRNDGNGIFTPCLNGDLGPEADTRGWASSWADVNNDGYLDLFVTHPSGFVGPEPTPSHFYNNNTEGKFTENFDYEFSQQLAPYTVATWYDFDMDSDVDLFIGSGPAGIPAVDRLYKNMFTETGTASFERIDSSPLATDLQDGQVWNFIDYDNDGDLDAFVTNYSGAPDRFYRNDNGNYISQENALTLTGPHLGNAWGDFDNDGDLDVIVTSDGGIGNLFFRNDNSTFVQDTSAFTLSGNTRASTIGDYDNDGKLDIFFSGTGTSNGSGLFHNVTENSNNWVEFNLEGTVSNHSALGTKLKLKAVIDGNTVWQYREVNGQNGFNSQNSLRVHFGLSNATTIDSVIILWSSGIEDILTNVSVNDVYPVIESVPSDFIRADFIADITDGAGAPLTVQFRDISVVENSNPITSWEWDFDNDGTIDATEQNPEWIYNTIGMHTVKLTVGRGVSTDTKIKADYIDISRTPGYPIISYENPSFTDTSVVPGARKLFTVSAYDTSGYDIEYKWKLNGKAKDIDSNYNYTALSILPIPPPRTDTVTVEISNGYNSTFRTWYIHVEEPNDVTDENTNLPDQFSLTQNYPNPFNPSTSIKYAIPEESNVVLKVYNIVGQEIAVLVNEKKAAGYYGTDFKGENLPSGIYIYTLTAGSFTSSRKMILLK